MGQPRLGTLPYERVEPDGTVLLREGHAAVGLQVRAWPHGIAWPHDCHIYHHALKVPTDKPPVRPATDPFALMVEEKYLAGLRQPYRIVSVLTLVSREAERARTAARYLATASDGHVLGAHEVVKFLATLCNLRESGLSAPAGGQLRGYLWEQEVGVHRRWVELRRSAQTFVAVCSLAALPQDTAGEAFEQLAQLRRTFAVVQSFEPQPQTQALAQLRTQVRRLQMTQSDAQSLRDQADELLGELVTERVVCGTHSLAVHVAADSEDELKIATAEVRAVLNTRGFALTEESLGLAPAYASAFHAGHLAPRQTQITSANVGDMAITPTAGGTIEHEWGALTTLLTRRGELHAFSLHVGDVGHTAVMGPTGEGKSVFLSFLAAQARLRDIRLFWIDKDQGARATVAALGGPYYLLEQGQPLGDPLRLDGTREVRAWLETFLARETDSFAELLAEAVDALYELPATERRFEHLEEFLRAGGSATENLRRWCPGGRLHRVFTAPADGAEGARPGTSLPPVVGYDFTSLLRTDYAGLALSYLFLRFELALRQHGRYLLLIDEAWLAFADPGVSAYLENYIRTIRKFGGAIVFATQSARDLEGPLASVIREQCPTLICFRCLGADESAYALAGVDAAQVAQIRRLARRREFLLVQGGESLVLQCDLSHIPQVLDVFAARDQFDRQREMFLGEAADRV